ncbi:hypothetical protein N7444_008188 [Penicillium canescens]|nr:hypothetical protein N7444_008188 [Penicillium canescens]
MSFFDRQGIPESVIRRQLPARLTSRTELFNDSSDGETSESDGSPDLKMMAIANMYGEFPTGRYENWGKCPSLYPNIRSVMSQRLESRESLLRWATLLYRGAWYASESGNISDVRKMASKSRKYRVELLGAEDDEALPSRRRNRSSSRS